MIQTLLIVMHLIILQKILVSKVVFFDIGVIKKMKFLYMRASTTENKQSLARQEKFGRDNNIPESNRFREYASGAKNDRVEIK